MTNDKGLKIHEYFDNFQGKSFNVSKIKMHRSAKQRLVKQKLAKPTSSKKLGYEVFLPAAVVGSAWLMYNKFWPPQPAIHFIRESEDVSITPPDALVSIPSNTHRTSGVNSDDWDTREIKSEWDTIPRCVEKNSIPIPDAPEIVVKDIVQDRIEAVSKEAVPTKWSGSCLEPLTLEVDRQVEICLSEPYVADSKHSGLVFFQMQIEEATWDNISPWLLEIHLQAGEDKVVTQFTQKIETNVAETPQTFLHGTVPLHFNENDSLQIFCRNTTSCALLMKTTSIQVLRS